MISCQEVHIYEVFVRELKKNPEGVIITSPTTRASSAGGRLGEMRRTREAKEIERYTLRTENPYVSHLNPYVLSYRHNPCPLQGPSSYIVPVHYRAPLALDYAPKNNRQNNKVSGRY